MFRKLSTNTSVPLGFSFAEHRATPAADFVSARYCLGAPSTLLARGFASYFGLLLSGLNPGAGYKRKQGGV